MEIIDVTAAIIENNGRFLIAKRKKGKHLGGKWEFPGGKVEHGETPEACLLRELEEELGIVVEVGNFVAEGIFGYEDRKIRLLGYSAKYVSGEFQLNAHEEVRWVSADEFDGYDFAEADLPLIKEITSKEA